MEKEGWMEKMRFEVSAECCESFARTDVRRQTIPNSRSCRAKISSTKWDVTTSNREKVGRGSVTLRLTVFEIFTVRWSKFRPPKSEKQLPGHICTIMQNFTTIDSTIAEISVSYKKLTSNLTSDKTNTSQALRLPHNETKHRAVSLQQLIFLFWRQ